MEELFMATKEFAALKILEKIDQKKSPWQKPRLWVIQSKETMAKDGWWKSNDFGPSCES